MLSPRKWKEHDIGSPIALAGTRCNRRCYAIPESCRRWSISSILSAQQRVWILNLDVHNRHLQYNTTHPFLLRPRVRLQVQMCRHLDSSDIYNFHAAVGHWRTPYRKHWLAILVQDSRTRFRAARYSTRGCKAPYVTPYGRPWSSMTGNDAS